MFARALVQVVLLLQGSAAVPQGALVEHADGRREWTSPAAVRALVRADGGLEPLAVRLAHEAKPQVAAKERMELDLAGGDRLVGSPVGGEGEALTFELAAGPLVSLPVEALRRAVFAGRIPQGAAATLVAADDTDRLYLRVGTRLDRVDGTIERFSAAGVEFDGIAGKRVHPWSDVAGFFVAPLDGEVVDTRPAAGRVRIELVDGGRIGGILRAVDADAVTLELGGAPLRLPLAAVAEITADDGRIAHLGELPMSVDGGRPFGDDLGLVFAPRIDRAVHGGPLLAGEAVVPRGIGVLAPTRLEWELDGTWQRLLVEAGVDGSTTRLAARGSVVFAIEVDGERRWKSGVVSGGEETITVPPIDVAGARRLAFVTEDAGDGFAGDRANWLRPRLVRTETGPAAEPARR